MFIREMTKYLGVTLFKETEQLGGTSNLRLPKAGPETCEVMKKHTAWAPLRSSTQLRGEACKVSVELWAGPGAWMQVIMKFLQPGCFWQCFLPKPWLLWTLLMGTSIFAQSQDNGPQVHRAWHPRGFPSPCPHCPPPSFLYLGFLESFLSALTQRKQGQHQGEALLPKLLVPILIEAHAWSFYNETLLSPVWQPCGLLHYTGHIFHTYTIQLLPLTTGLLCGWLTEPIMRRSKNRLLPSGVSICCFTADNVLVTLQKVNSGAESPVTVSSFPSTPRPKSALRSWPNEPTWLCFLDRTYPSIPLGLCFCDFFCQKHLASPSSSSGPLRPSWNVISLQISPRFPKVTHLGSGF